MKIHRFISDFDFGQDPVLVTDRAVVHQIRDVLHLEIGEELVLGDGKGRTVGGTIAAVTPGSVSVSVVAERTGEGESGRRVVLYAAIAKRENFEWIAQKATEVGVAEIVPLITDRTVKQGIKRERLEKIIQEAAEQSGRAVVPTLLEPMSFERAIEHAGKNQQNFFFDVSGAAGDLSAQDPVGVFIGPEGGWSNQERAAAEQAGFLIRSLGPLTLRAETAALVAAYLAVTNTSL